MVQNVGGWSAFRDSEVVQPEPAIQRTRLIPGPDELIELDRNSNWWVIADYPVSARCSGRKLSGPDLPGVPGASGSYFSLCRWEDFGGDGRDPSSFLPPKRTLPIRCHQHRVSKFPIPRDIRWGEEGLRTLFFLRVPLKTKAVCFFILIRTLNLRSSLLTKF